MRGRDVVAAARDGQDPDARRLLEQLGTYLGVGLSGAINTFEPEYIVIGGGLSQGADLFLDRARDEASARALPGAGRAGADTARARAAPKPGLIGAGLLAAQEVESENRRYCGCNQEERGPVTTTTDTRALDELAINTIRTLSMDARAEGELRAPRGADGLAPLAYVLYTRVMRHNPSNADWPGRDRFVLSAGHASMLLYSIALPDAATR